jgi:hypothetical protein
MLFSAVTRSLAANVGNARPPISTFNHVRLTGFGVGGIMV